MNAPVCVAKGFDLIARKIREVAEAHDIPVVENPPLARALHGTVEIDQEIPQEHYRAVAEIIGYVMRLRRLVGGPRATVKCARKASCAIQRTGHERIVTVAAVQRRRRTQLHVGPGRMTATRHRTRDAAPASPREGGRPQRRARQRARQHRPGAAGRGRAGRGRHRLRVARPRQCRALYPGFLALLATVGVFSLFAFACGILRLSGGEAGQPADQNGARRCLRRHPRHRRRRARRLRQCRLSRSDRRRRRQRHAPGRARVHRRCGRLRGDLSAAQGGARGQAPAGGGPHRRHQGPAGALAADAGAAARRRHARRAAHGLVARRRDPRTRAPGERLPGIAARHRLSRSRAGRVLLRRCQGRRGLSQRHARELARPGSRPGRLRRAQARRSRRRRRRRAADDAAGARPARSRPRCSIST